MERQTLSRIVMVLGVLVAVVSVLADGLGIGAAPGIGWKQGFGIVVGIALIVIGGYWRRSSAPSP
jgi:hypothetical protein